MRNVWVVLCAAGCGFSLPGGAPDAGPSLDGAIADGAPADAAFDPTAGVDWFEWPEQQPSLGDAPWGTDLVDVARHLPSRYGSQYWSSNPVTAAHETSHGIHAHLRNYETPSAIGWNAFYVLDNRAAFVEEPDMLKSDIKARVPAVLRGPRYQLYLVEQTAWDDTPLYVMDEWNSYVNGAEVGVQQVQGGLWTGSWQDAVMGPLEFTAYAIATAKAVADLDPDYYATNLQFRRFTAWNIERAMTLFAQGRAMSEFTYDVQDEYLATLRTHADVEVLRQFARDTWTPAWTQTVLGF